MTFPCAFGTSAGEGAIVTAGGTALGLGINFGGSIRNLFAFCGIAGQETTAGCCPDWGRVSVPIGQRATPS